MDDPETPVSLTDSEWAVVTGILMARGNAELGLRIRDQLFEQWGNE